MSIPTSVNIKITALSDEKIERIRQWQTCGFVHPLTCGGTDCRSVLDVEYIDNVLNLVCPSCTYIQDYVPSVVLDTDLTQSPFWQHRPVD